jgi:hypothetical protein
MAAEITQIDPQSFLLQTYGGQDTNLISTFDVNTSLSSSSYIEYFTYDNNQDIITTNYNFTQYTIQNDGQSAGNEENVSEIILDPENILINNGLDQGEYTTYFNFFNKQIGSNLEQLYISEISSDRTELRLDSTNLSNADIVEQTTNFVTERENSPYFLDFYLNFGENQLVIANNIKLDNTDPNNPTILVKLYETLPEEFDINYSLWIVTIVEESRAYKVTFEDLPITISDTTPLSGPNFNLDLKDRVNNSTLELSYIDLITTSLTSSQNQLNSLLEEKEIDINVDYTDFLNFIHFSSAQARLENFYYKVSLIEDYSASIAVLNNTTNSSSSINSSATVYENKIDEIITNFDGYEYFLYYSDNQYAWPKTTTEKPYELAKTDSTAVASWFGSTNEYSPNYGGLALSASLYDNSNKDNLYYTIPEYLREDSANDPYQLFVEMVGQHYDNIWIYYRDITQKYNADNRLEYGISKDIVADAIRDFGVKLYQNNFSNEDLFTAFLGLTPDGALFPFPNITGSLPTPSGFEYVNTLISASNDYLPLDDVNKSLYKRIYHNLPYLLKSKGTLPGLRALITSYGIPDTILRINEYGGKDKVNSNDWDYWQNEFNYAFYTTGSGYIATPWELNPNWNSPDGVPSTVVFRFKTNGLPQTNIPHSQSLWYLNDVSSAPTNLLLTYTGSGYVSGSYSGSIIDPYHQYATLTFTPDYINYPNSSASIYLPFFDGEWWSVMVTRDEDDFGLTAGNKIYEGGDNGTLLGFFASASITEDSTLAWALPTNGSIFRRANPTLTQYKAFSGSYQEIRYYNTVLSENVFKDYIMNPYSIEGSAKNLNNGPNELAFRASLGGELYTGSTSIHPKVTGSWDITSSFISDSEFTFVNPIFAPNTEYFFYDQPVAGIKNTVSDKIRLENNNLPSGEVLSPFRALSQTTEASQSYTANINYLEVAFSPQNEINEDIMDQLGFFNIGEYIGDPSLRSTPDTSYPALDKLRNDYFQKYTKNYDLVDFIRLIKFFDNSLFKMIKDFVPARTSLASGIVIKQHLLERNKYPQPQVDTYSTLAYTSYSELPSSSLATVYFTSSNFQFVEISSGSSILFPYYSSSGILPSTFNLSTGIYTVDSPITINFIASLTTSGSGLTGWTLTQNGFSVIPGFATNIPGSPVTEYISSSFTAQPGDVIQIEGFKPNSTPSTVTSGYLEFSYAPNLGTINNIPLTFQDISVSGTIAPQWNIYNPGTVENFSGGTGGSFEIFNYVGNVSQSWYETVQSPLGLVVTLHNEQDEFYDGEFSGSVIVVTTQSLNQPYAIENVVLNYKHVYYFSTGSNEQNVFQSNFLNQKTSPQPGEILFLCTIPGSKPTFTTNAITNTYTVTNIKISKQDCTNTDSTLPLGQLSQLLIQIPPFDPTDPNSSTQVITYNIDGINEYSDYYSYETSYNPWIIPNQIGGIADPNKDQQLFDYTISSSVTASYNVGNGSPKTIINWNSTLSGTNLPHYGTPYFNTSSGIITFENTPNTPIQISASISTFGNDPTTRIIRFIRDREGVTTTLTQANYNANASVTTLLNSTIYPVQGDQYYFELTKTDTGVSVNVVSASISTTQNRNQFILDSFYNAPLNSSCSFAIIEPYITIPNFYNSDQNALLNDVQHERTSLIYEDVDYSTGLLVPTNFEAIISGSATKAAVQDSNYTTKRHIIPRYEGSKTTSQFLNVWTDGDTGTYGKLPSVESNKTYIAYCDSAGGWAPEKMNCSAAFVKYFISEDGDIISPNTEEAGLYINQGTFISGENIKIESLGTSTNTAAQYRTVFRGGTKIEPILYNQIKHYQNQSMSFASSIEFTDGNPNLTTTVNNYTATLKDSNGAFGSTSWSGIAMDTIVVSGSAITTELANPNVYTASAALISEGLDLVFQVDLNIFNNNLTTSTAYARIIRNRSGVITPVGETGYVNGSGYIPGATVKPLSFTTTVLAPELAVGDVFQIQLITGNSSVGYNSTSTWKISTNPLPTAPISTTGLFYTLPLPGLETALFSTSSALIQYYENQETHQKDIDGSGFNPVTLPFTIKTGDEFRFEGDESKTFMVLDSTVVPNLFIPPFTSPTLVIALDHPISGSGINVNEFVLRRYVDSAGSFIFNGDVPSGVASPYLIKPEYISDKMEQNIGKYIADLTNKGLL